MTLKNVEAITFDFGNTLFDYYPVIIHSFGRTIERITGTGDKYDSNRILESYFKAHLKVAEVSRSQGKSSNQRDNVYWSTFNRLILNDLGVHDPRGQQIKDEEWADHPEAEMYPEVSQVLADLHERGYQIGVITNTFDDFPLRKLQKTSLIEYIDVVAQSYELGSWKPDSKIFEWTCKQMGCRIDRTVHVGDEYYQDIEGSRKAGFLDGILYLPFDPLPNILQKSLSPSEEYITNLKELLQIFE
ncbi:MAG: HAD family hydrolase [Promethearchaeota archaeon]